MRDLSKTYIVGALLLPLLLGACTSTVRKPDPLPPAHGGSVQVRIQTTGSANEVCSDQRLAATAQRVASALLASDGAYYAVEILPVGRQRIACFNYPFLPNFVRWMTVVGYLHPAIYQPYAAYTLTVSAGGEEILRKDVQQVERSTKSPLNFVRYRTLSTEAEWVFEQSLAAALGDAVRGGLTARVRNPAVVPATASVGTARRDESAAIVNPGPGFASAGSALRTAPTHQGAIVQTFAIDTPVQLRTRISNAMGEWWFLAAGSQMGWVQSEQVRN